MEVKGAGKLANEYRHIFVGHGARLEIIATETEESKWMLSVVNEVGIAFNWNDGFETKDCAIEAALDSIREEGVEQFQDVEGFEYLLDDYYDE